MKAKFQSCEDSGVKIAFKFPSGEKTCHVFSDSSTVKVRMCTCFPYFLYSKSHLIELAKG